MSSVAKKVKISNDFIENIQENRVKAGESVLKFPFNKKRVRILSAEQEVKTGSDGIVYWMFRENRVQDNWSLLMAQKLALKNEVPLHVCFCLLPKFLDAAYRHFHFLLNGNILNKYIILIF